MNLKEVETLRNDEGLAIQIHQTLEEIVKKISQGGVCITLAEFSKED